MSFSLGQNFKNRSNPRERERRSTLRGERAGFLRLRLSARVRERRRQKTPRRNRSIDFAMCAFLHTQIIESAFFSKTKNDREFSNRGEKNSIRSSVSLSLRLSNATSNTEPPKSGNTRERERERERPIKTAKGGEPFGICARFFLEKKSALENKEKSSSLLP